MEFTTNQKQALESTNSKILVSAGAGSGKTAVLSSRVVKLVESGEPISNIVVVTFTRAAANEMKCRIKAKLLESEVEFAREQANAIESAPISTLDGYAGSLLRKYFYEVGLDPAFGVLDEKMSDMLKNQSITNVMRKLTNEKDAGFIDLVDVFFQNRKDTSLRELVFSISSFLDSLADPDKFVSQAKLLYRQPLSNNDTVKYLTTEVASRAKHFKNILIKLVEKCKEAPKLLDVLYELEFHLDRLKKDNTLQQSRIAVSSFALSCKIMHAGQEELADEVDNFRAQVKKFFEQLQDVFCVDKNLEDEERESNESASRIDAIFDLVEKYKSEYNSLKSDLGALDFADIERKFLELLQKPDVCEQIASGISNLFVDEFQDTNRLQSEIYKLLAKNSVFYVGDVKQSIYAFRLAEPKIFQEHREEFRQNGGEVVNLDDNFRSHQDLIGFVNLLFTKIMTQEVGGENYEVEGKMKRGGEPFPKPTSSGLLSMFASSNFPRVKICAIKKAKNVAKSNDNLPLYEVQNHENSKDEKISSAIAEGRELVKVLEEISNAKIYDPKLKAEREVQSGDIAILCASRRDYMKTLLDTAAEAGHSFSLDVARDVFEDADMAEILNLLKLVQNPKQDVALFVGLAGYFGGLSSEELAQIKLKFGKNTVNFFDAIELFRKTGKQQMEQTWQKVDKLFKLLEELRFVASYSNVTDLFELIDQKTNFVSFISQKDEQTILLYEHLVDQIRNLSINRDLDELLWTAQNVGFTSSAMPSPARGAAIVDEAGNASRTFQNVLVTTIHKSKGLEFPIVILVGAGRQFNRDDLKKDFVISRKLGIGISSFDTMERTKSGNIQKSAVKLDLQRQMLEEDVRLLYVALTRAINNLVIIGVGDPTDQNTISKSIISSNCFFDLVSKFFDMKFPPLYVSVAKHSFEMLANDESKVLPSQILTFDASAELVEQYKKSFDFVYPHAEATLLSQKYSVTELAEREKVVEMRSLANESTTQIGNAYHHIMQHIDFAVETKDDLEKEKLRLTSAGLVLQEEFDLVDDDKILKCLCSPLFMVLKKGNRKIAREQEFLMSVPACDVGLGEDIKDLVLVQGVFDLVVDDNDSVLVIDYKTGGASSKTALAEKHKKQMELYGMSAKKVFKKPVKVAIWSFVLDDFVRVI